MKTIESTYCMGKRIFIQLRSNLWPNTFPPKLTINAGEKTLIHYHWL